MEPLAGSTLAVAQAENVRACRVELSGIVQGVGFRPFVYRLAQELELAGWVANDARGVVVHVEGGPASVVAFLERLRSDAPPRARIDRLCCRAVPPEGHERFRVAVSRDVEVHVVPVAADAATCDACLSELFDPRDRRYRHAFLSCIACGPRFTIVRDVPYDRVRTTMAEHSMCANCAREYGDPLDRRFHAEPIACHDCGPRLQWLDHRGAALAGDPIEAAARELKRGAIVAVKGTGGYHLAVDATSAQATGRLRARKHRWEKPFAVLVADLASARALAEVDATAAAWLTSPSAPIVLVAKRVDGPLAEAVAPRQRRVGLMLPNAPIHHLIVRAAGRPLVLTSGNVVDEPIAYRDEDARVRLAAIADFFLAHDRPIHVRADDSVVAVESGRATMVRRARGYAPTPRRLPLAAPRPVLACGAELKSTFCLVRGDEAIISQHIGDLENWETLQSFAAGVEHFQRLFDVEPQAIACDLHPEYLSTKYALTRAGRELVQVQHHHAHIAACLAEHGETGPVIGLAGDGLGYGPDGTLWGGEVLIADLQRYERVGHLERVAMPGGVAAVREPWRMAAAWLARSGMDGSAVAAPLRQRQAERWDVIVRLAASPRSLQTSSLGRLFDAVAAWLGVCDVAGYEGQAAIELDQLADPDALVSERDGYAVELVGEAPFVIGVGGLLRSIGRDFERGVPVAVIAARFHCGVADALVAACLRVRAERGLDRVALGGGAFQNALLRERVVGELRRCGFGVWVPEEVPVNDGGISFGQAAVAAARLRAAA